MMIPPEIRQGDADWLYSLRATDAGVGIHPASSAALLARATRIVGSEPVQWAVEVGHAMATRIIREMPGFGGSAEAFEVLRMGTESTTIQSLILLAGADPEGSATIEALDGVTDFVRRGIGLELVLRGIRLGHAGMSEAFLSASKRLVEPEMRLDRAEHISAALFEYIDSFAAVMAERFLEEQVRWSTSDAAAKRELVTAILRGSRPEVADGSRRLGYDLNETHLSFVVWSSAGNLDIDAVELQDAALSIVRRMRSAPRLIVPVGSGVVWGWGAIGKLTADLAEPFTSLPLSPDIHVAFGLPGRGMEGFARSHREAQAARELTQGSGSGTQLVFYRDVDLVSLLVSDRVRAVEFVYRELDGLTAATPAAQDLRDTLLVFLEEQNSPHAAARRLNVARNTVSYRVRRAEQLMGRDISVRRTQLLTALLIARHLGPAMMEDGTVRT